MRVYNFAAGPSMMPLEVLLKAQSEMFDYNGTGMSVMEMSHRTPAYSKIITEAEEDLRKLMEIPDNYKVLFLQGGATTQFASIPLNLMITGKADYIVSGLFSGLSQKEAVRYGNARIIASSEDKNFSYVPYVTEFNKDSDYVHICFNNTIYGTKYYYIPETGDIPLVADISSFILSEPLDVSKFGLLYAGAQKNVAPAGLTIVIVREDLLGHEMEFTPKMLNYKIMADNRSMFNTPPAYDIYIAGLVFKYLLEKGGLEEIKKINETKASILYDYLDSSKLFIATADKKSRSTMNVCFRTGDAELDEKFCLEAEKEGLVCLRGHRSTKGMRASIYNAMPIEGVIKLRDFMEKFEKENL